MARALCWDLRPDSPLFCQRPAVWSWAHCTTSLGLGLFICKWGGWTGKVILFWNSVNVSSPVCPSPDFPSRTYHVEICARAQQPGSCLWNSSGPWVFGVELYGSEKPREPGWVYHCPASAQPRLLTHRRAQQTTVLKGTTTVWAECLTPPQWGQPWCSPCPDLFAELLGMCS